MLANDDTRKRGRSPAGWNTVAGLTLLAALLLTGGCAVNPAPGAALLSKEEAVAARAKERWAALLEAEMSQAYAFMSPATREVLSLKTYKATVNPKLWTSAKVNGVECSSDDLCSAKVLIGYRVGLNMGAAFAGEQELRETWRRESGQWWFVPNRSEGGLGR